MRIHVRYIANYRELTKVYFNSWGNTAYTQSHPSIFDDFPLQKNENSLMLRKNELSLPLHSVWYKLDDFIGRTFIMFISATFLVTLSSRSHQHLNWSHVHHVNINDFIGHNFITFISTKFSICSYFVFHIPSINLFFPIRLLSVDNIWNKIQRNVLRHSVSST